MTTVKLPIFSDWKSTLSRWAQELVIRISNLESKVAVPVGGIIGITIDTVPTGYLNCDGSEVGRGTYAALFQAIGTTRGSGNGTTTFNLPTIAGSGHISKYVIKY